MNMNYQWIAIEHYRMHSVEEWPDSPRKAAVLAGIRSSIDSLVRATRGKAVHDCEICLARTQFRGVIQFPLSRAA